MTVLVVHINKIGQQKLCFDSLVANIHGLRFVLVSLTYCISILIIVLKMLANLIIMVPFVHYNLGRLQHLGL